MRKFIAFFAGILVIALLLSSCEMAKIQLEYMLFGITQAQANTEAAQSTTFDPAYAAAYLKALEAERNALLKLMEEVQTVEDLHKVRDRLTEVHSQLDALESQMRAEDGFDLIGTAARIKALEAERDALLKLMEEVQTVEEVQMVADRISEVSSQLDALEDQMREALKADDQ